MIEKMYFIAGLPRSGSTLLCNILAQNPRFHATATSGLPGVIEPLKNGWNKIGEHMAMDADRSKAHQRGTLLGALYGYHNHVGRPVIFDKSRGWPALAETLKWLLPEVRILCPVRDLRQVVESMEARYRASLATGAPALGKGVRTMEQRAEFFASSSGTVGASYDTLRDAINRGHYDVMHFVRFEDLTSNPAGTMKEIYEFLGEEWFDHDFDNVEQVTKEDDRVHTFDGLHTIRRKVEPVKPRNALGEFGKKYNGANFWENLPAK